MTRDVIGWDIGGVNTKVALVRNGRVHAALSHPYEVQRDPAALAPLLTSLARRVGASGSEHHAVTMTAELSQLFRTKREGVTFVLAAVRTAFPERDVRVFTVDGRFLTVADAEGEPLAVAASNWAATARVVAREHPDAILVDVGTTTADVIPIVAGRVAAVGATDPERLASGELVYSGALRTPVDAIVHDVPLGSGRARVSAESFALIGDVHVWRLALGSADYTVPTPDGRSTTREAAGERLARVVCGDREMLDDATITAIAESVAEAQVADIARAIATVRARHPQLDTAVVTGLGTFIAERAASVAGLRVRALAERFGRDASRCAPAAAVALEMGVRFEFHPSNAESGETRSLPTPPPAPRSARPADDVSRPPPPLVETARVGEAAIRIVVKVGGSLLDDPRLLANVLDTIVAAARHTAIAVVPGGGPFADAIRAIDREMGIDASAAHWMAVLAMDQHAHLLTTRRPELRLARTMADVRDAIASGSVPVVAPYQMLHDTDPLPHGWDVTGDSIAAWLTGALGARKLVLVKHPGADPARALDDYFPHALAPSVAFTIAAADDRDTLRAELTWQS